jgi:hypothetical protein
MAAQNRIDRFRIVLIKPSKYDDDGYVIRFWRGVLPSNTLNVMHGLTEDVRQRRVFGDLAIDIRVFDETAQQVPMKRIVRWGKQRGAKVLVCLVGVQTNQFPRAVDMAKYFRAHGLDVIIGGFHTSGTIAMLGEQEPDIQDLLREKISVVCGEVEGKWESILSDGLHGELKPLYSYAQDLQNLVDIEVAPLPKPSPKTMSHFAYPGLGTADTSRGCPFACTFCTIINVQGRKMRERSPAEIAGLIRRNYQQYNVNAYFFTDDNFARKKLWRETFEALIGLRAEGIKINFMMQVDLARKPKDFVRLAAQAGCTQVFIGMESVNPENLKAEGKSQNKVEEYVDIVKSWHDAGVLVQTGYIIGLPHDTQEQVARDVQHLSEAIQPDIASFFMLTPLPGSHDHREMKKRGEWMDPDFNKRDSFHAAIEHPLMTVEEWTQAYENSWSVFYGKENLIRVLARWSHNPKAYWRAMFMLVWYKNASLIEKQHPMIAGFFRLKDRLSRRPGFAIDPLWSHLRKRAKEVAQLFLSWARFAKEMEEVWLQTRPKSEAEKRLFSEIERIQGEIWQTLKIAEWRKAYEDARVALPRKARALLDPFEELSSKILVTGQDLEKFLKQWASLEKTLSKVQRRFAWEDDRARHWLNQLRELHDHTLRNARLHEWRDIYPGLNDKILSRAHFICLKFDALNNRVIYSRQDLQNFWERTWESLREKRFLSLRPGKLVVNFINEVYLTMSFAYRLISSYRSS